SLQTCAITKVGTCAEDNHTIAVDPKYIPLRSNMYLLGSGWLGSSQREAEDTGSSVKNYHVDVFFGTRLDDCINGLGTSSGWIEFDSY
ncbi:MAG TPA: 3D domain-containing protein, partial [Pyrinomonadaceae bacterium]